MTKQVLIFEDNDALRKSLEELLSLSNDFVIKGSYDNCMDVALLVKQYNPDVILMDIDMPGMSGIDAVKTVRQFNRQAAIVMLTVFDDREHVLDAIRAGASGYLLKKHVSEKLVSSIHEVLTGGAPMSPAIARLLISSMQHVSTPQYNFTGREKQILELLCKGNSYKMIAAITGLAFETIRTYIKKIYEKMQVHSATEAVSKAINERLV